MRATKWARSLVLGALAATLLGTPALARRDPPPDKGQGCSSADWEIVIERDQPTPFRLCVIPKKDTRR